MRRKGPPTGVEADGPLSRDSAPDNGYLASAARNDPLYAPPQFLRARCTARITRQTRLIPVSLQVARIDQREPTCNTRARKKRTRVGKCVVLCKTARAPPRKAR